MAEFKKKLVKVGEHGGKKGIKNFYQQISRKLVRKIDKETLVHWV